MEGGFRNAILQVIGVYWRKLYRLSPQGSSKDTRFVNIMLEHSGHPPKAEADDIPVDGPQLGARCSAGTGTSSASKKNYFRKPLPLSVYDVFTT